MDHVLPEDGVICNVNAEKNWFEFQFRGGSLKRIAFEVVQESPVLKHAFEALTVEARTSFSLSSTFETKALHAWASVAPLNTVPLSNAIELAECIQVRLLPAPTEQVCTC
jgi:hypothetical protein